MTTPFTTSTTDSQMHNNIMAAGSRDRPPMLAMGRYPQWQSHFSRYIDTRPNGDALRKCILEGPYQPTTVTIPAVPAIENYPTVLERTAVETILTMSPKNKAHYESKKEAIHLLLTGIGDEIYSIIDACKTAHEIKFTSHDGESMESYYSRFMTIVKQQHDLDTVSYHKLFDVLKQYQKEVNEIHPERIAKNANLLALVVAASPYPDPYYQASKSHKSFAPPVKNKREKDKIKTKPDQIKKKREAWRSPENSRAVSVDRARKTRYKGGPRLSMSQSCTTKDGP
nr:hypothetical protein [Tanacetum cinerariifolium]